MRICLLTPVLDAFKGGNHVPLLSACKDAHFTVLTNRMKPASTELPSNTRVEAINARLGSYYGGVADYLFARAVLKRYPPHHRFWKQFDVIHLNQTMGPALLRLRETNIPMCLLVHHPASVDKVIAVEESSFVDGLLWRAKYAALVRWQGYFCRSSLCVVTVSRTAADRIAMDYGCERAKIVVVPNGVDGTTFSPGDVSQADFDVIAVGSLVHPRKGFRYLIEAYRSLAAKGYRIADVGRRSDAQQTELKRISQVRSFGTVGHDQLLSLLRRSSTLVSASLYEGFGLSLIEALACGKPAFAFDAGATRETLEPIDPSLVVPLRDTSALVERVASFLSLSAAERTAVGDAYRAKVITLYPLSRSADALMAVYRRLVAAANLH